MEAFDIKILGGFSSDLAKKIKKKKYFKRDPIFVRFQMQAFDIKILCGFSSDCVKPKL